MKTHLMVLNVYSDDSEEQKSLFLDQMDTLNKASTMNAVFDVLQGFLNYDLIEHLIGLLGSDEDKERLKTNLRVCQTQAVQMSHQCGYKHSFTV